MFHFTQNWVLIAFIAPFLWALVVLLDIYFVHRVYQKPHEGTIISGLFQGLVLLLFPFIGFTWPGNAAAILFILGGLAFILYFHGYFTTMILIGDGALVQIVVNFATILVPILAWIFIKENLDFVSYMGITLAFVGGIALSWDGEIQKKDLSIIFKTLIPSVFLLSFSMILQKRGYEIVGGDNFWPGFFLFSFGVLIGSVIVFLFHNERKSLVKRISNLSKKYFFVFVLAEGLSIAGTLASQKTISLAPAVSFVAAIESLLPLFVILGSIVVMFFYRGHTVEADYTKQIEGLKGKSIAIILIAAGIYLVVRS